jgi:CPA2 family monovalent cation:H+ antiporter-2
MYGWTALIARTAPTNEPPSPKGTAIETSHEPVLISTIAVGLMAAFVGGFIAKRIGLPTIVGYIVAGVVLGPFTPGFIADVDLALELADIGIILLMFGVGIHFSLRDLAAVRSIAIPGALIQIVIATILGLMLGVGLGWGIGGGLVLGLSLSVASTVVLLRAITDRGELDTSQGRIAIGWLIVEDLVTIVILVLLPTVAPLMGGTAETSTDTLGTLGNVALGLGKAALFVIIMIVAGTRLVPRLLTLVSNEGSKELFTLAVLAIAIGFAYLSSTVFGVSFALGAFLAGAVVGESDVSHQAAADALPLRDAFAVLFFVSVGMLLDPATLLEMPLAIVAVLVLIVVSKALIKFAIVALFGYPVRVALTVGVGLAQIGEFSFILGTVGLSLGLLPPEGFQLIVAGALLSIALNPLLFHYVDPLEARLRTNPLMIRLLGWRAGDLAELAPTEDDAPLRLHAILCGYGQVGRLVARALERRGFTYVVISQQRTEVEALRERGIQALFGEASNIELLERAHVEHARLVIVASSDPHVSPLIVERAKALNPALDFVVRTHGDEETAQLRAISPKVQAVHGQRELAVQMARYSLRRFGVDAVEAEAIAQGLRGRPVSVVLASPRASSRRANLGSRLRGIAQRLSGRRAEET